MEKRRYKQFAFTLAETLITLGIIGVVAAMTIPALISKYQKHVVETKLKEDYSILQQVMKGAEADDKYFNPLVKESVSDLKVWFNTYFAPYMKYSQVCYEETGCWTKQPVKALSGETAFCARTGIGIGYNIITVRLNNGSNLCLDSYSVSDAWDVHRIKMQTEGLIIFIDANGDSGPNIVGKDIYAVAFTEKGLVPSGSDASTATINNNCSTGITGNNAGFFCLAKVRSNGWEIPDDVWKKKI